MVLLRHWQKNFGKSKACLHFHYSVRTTALNSVNYEILYIVSIHHRALKITTDQGLGLSLLCSENCLLCFLALLQFCAYYTRFYATPQSIMLVIIHSLMQKPA